MIKDYHAEFGVERMCRIFKISRSGYYDWLNRKPSKRQLENQQMKQQIRTIYAESKMRYGSPKITDELRGRGWIISRPRVARMMRYEGIRSIISKRFRGMTTDSKHHLPVADNILNRNFVADMEGLKWVSDITYIPTVQGWVYLTMIMDLYDRKIIGWSVSTSMTTQSTVMPAWKMAIANRPISQKLIFHSDRGVQYASYQFSDELKRQKVVQSMSRKGNCWDNAVAENFFKIVKSEMVDHVNFQSIYDAKMEIFEFIEIWYNRQRKHSYLGYKTPLEYGKIKYSKCA
jgi:putative transposase